MINSVDRRHHEQQKQDAATRRHESSGFGSMAEQAAAHDVVPLPDEVGVEDADESR
jgi:hypothetical protein